MDLPYSGRKRKRTAVEWGDDDAAHKKDVKRLCIDKFAEFLNAARMKDVNSSNHNHRRGFSFFNMRKRKRTAAEWAYAGYLARKRSLFTDKHGHDQIVEAKEISSIQSRSAKWSELPTDLLELILMKLVSSIFHIVRFRRILNFKAVCQSWRAAAKSCGSYVFKFPGSSWPCLLLPNRNIWSLFEPCIGGVYRVRNFDCDLFPNGTIVGSSYGWIVMFYKDKYSKISKAHIFNPVTGASIPIPGKQTLPKKKGQTVSQAIISSNPSFNNNFVVVVEYDSRLAYYKHGDQDMSWKKLDDGNHGDMPYKHHEHPIHPYAGCLIVFHDDHLVSSARQLTKVWNFKECPPIQCSIIEDSPDHKSFEDNYLVESLTGEVLRLGKGWGETNYLRDYQICVENLNLAEGKWENLQRLGDHQSLFVFRKQLLSLPNPCFLGFEKNSIYFGVTKLTKWKEYHTYNLEKAKLNSNRKFKFSERGIDGCRRPLWIVPNPW